MASVAQAKLAIGIFFLAACYDFYTDTQSGSSPSSVGTNFMRIFALLGIAKVVKKLISNTISLYFHSHLSSMYTDVQIETSNF